jgi:hypothetical protein
MKAFDTLKDNWRFLAVNLTPTVTLILATLCTHVLFQVESPVLAFSLQAWVSVQWLLHGLSMNKVLFFMDTRRARRKETLEREVDFADIVEGLNAAQTEIAVLLDDLLRLTTETGALPSVQVAIVNRDATKLITAYQRKIIDLINFVNKNPDPKVFYRSKGKGN